MATITGKGTQLEILNLTLSSSDDIQIGFVNKVNSVLIKCRTSVDIQVRTSRGASNYFTIPAGNTLELDVSTNTTENIWLRSVSSTPVAEIIGIYGG